MFYVIAVRMYATLRPTDITAGLVYTRTFKPRRKAFREPKLPLPRDLNKTLLQLLAHENIACRAPIYESYDKNVQAISVIEAGQADAGSYRSIFKP